MLCSRPFLYVALLLSILVAGCGSQGQKRLQMGDAAPSFSGRDVKGTVISLAQLEGSPIVLRFFLPDCKFCKADTQVFNRYYQNYHEQGLEIIYIDTSPEGNGVEKFVADLNIQFRVLHDTTGEIAASYLIKAVPQTIILSPDLKIRGAILGGVSEAELNQLLSPYLKIEG